MFKKRFRFFGFTDLFQKQAESHIELWIIRNQVQGFAINCKTPMAETKAPSALKRRPFAGRRDVKQGSQRADAILQGQRYGCRESNSVRTPGRGLGNEAWQREVEHTTFNNRLQPTQIGLGTSGADSSVMKLDYEYGTTTNNGNVMSQIITAPSLTVNQCY